MSSQLSIVGTGWLPDLPDHRDKTFARAIEHLRLSASGTKSASKPAAKPRRTFEAWAQARMRQADVNRTQSPTTIAGSRDKWADAILRAFGKKRESVTLAEPPPFASSDFPKRIDLRVFMSPVEDQGRLGSCTAQAVTGLIEYLQIINHGCYVDCSRLFLYKTTRNLLGLQGDTGATIRESIKATRLFGACPEHFWPYNISRFEGEPSSFCYAFASNYKGLSYYRLADLTEILRSIAQGYPVALGFSCFESLQSRTVSSTGVIPYPDRSEQSIGGHAVLAVGYFLKEAAREGEPNDDGYLIIRNSWGSDWGIAGYGFLPFRYIQGKIEGVDRSATPALSDDYWTIAMLECPDLDNARQAPFLSESAAKESQRKYASTEIVKAPVRRPLYGDGGSPVYGDDGGSGTYGGGGGSQTF